MTRTAKLRGTAAACLLLVPLSLSGCGWFGQENAAAVDPPPADVEMEMLKAIEQQESSGVFAPVLTETPSTGAAAHSSSGGAAASADDSAAYRATVYLANDNGQLAPVSLTLPSATSDDLLKDALSALIENGMYAPLLPAGFHGVLPAGTEVKSVTVDAETGIAVAEFDAQFGDYDPADERKLMEAITWTLTGRDDIKGVQLWMDGKKLSEMPLKGTPLDRPLTRGMGINLPKQVMNNSSAVTVYFTAATDAGLQYYVPVTRFVGAGAEPVQAALAALLAGPDLGTGLEMSTTTGTALEGVEQGQNGVVTVSLTDEMFADGGEVPAEMLESVVLTVAQNMDDALVQIRLNGSETVTGTNNINYGQPVSAPEYVNLLAL